MDVGKAWWALERYGGRWRGVVVCPGDVLPQQSTEKERLLRREQMIYHKDPYETNLGSGKRQCVAKYLFL